VKPNPVHPAERHPTDPRRTSPSTVVVWRGAAYTLACAGDGALCAALTRHTLERNGK
jgi:hypothetical protein